MRTLREILNEAQPGKLPDANRQLRMGEAMAVGARTVRGAVVGDVLVLPETAKAMAILGVYAVAGTVTGRFTAAAPDSTPATTQAAVDPAGNIEFAAADAVTIAEVVYIAHEGGIYEDLIDVDAGGTEQGSLQGLRGAAMIISVEATAGTATGAKTVAGRGTTPGAGAAAIADDPTLIEFAAADAVTQARVRYIAQPGIGDAPQAVGLELDASDKAY